MDRKFHTLAKQRDPRPRLLEGVIVTLGCIATHLEALDDGLGVDRCVAEVHSMNAKPF